MPRKKRISSSIKKNARKINTKKKRIKKGNNRNTKLIYKIGQSPQLSRKPIKQPKSPLRYSLSTYTPANISSILTDKEARKEYQRLRSLAIKRYKRLQQKGREESSSLYGRIENYIPSSLLDERDLSYLLADLANTLLSAQSSLAGVTSIQQKAIGTFHRHGYNFINESNIEDFGKYMKRMRSISIGKYFDSIRAADLFEETLEENMSPEEVEKSFLEFEQKQFKSRQRAKKRK